MAAVNTHTAVGNIEDMGDVITNIAPSETPLLSGSGRAKAVGVVHSWLEDDLRAPKSNHRPEGAALVIDTATPRKIKYNVTQIMSAGYDVTGTQEVVAKHGVRSELGYQMQKAAKEIALDHEWALINNTAAVLQGSYGGDHAPAPTGGTISAFEEAGTAGTMDRLFRGIPDFIETNVVTTTAGLLEDDLNEAIQRAWEQGGNPSRAYMSANNKRVASGFSAPDRTVNKDQHDKKLSRVIRYYESDFGVIELMPHRLFPDNMVLLIDPQYIKLADLRPFHREKLPKTTDSVNGIILGETTLEVKAEKAHAKIVVTTPPAPFAANTPVNAFSVPV
jgi:hypothetical protein